MRSGAAYEAWFFVRAGIVADRNDLAYIQHLAGEYQQYRERIGVLVIAAPATLQHPARMSGRAGAGPGETPIASSVDAARRRTPLLDGECEPCAESAADLR
jgi:hypothetical protein